MENLNQKDFYKWLGYKLPKLGKIEPFRWSWDNYTLKEKISILINGLKNIYENKYK